MYILYIMLKSLIINREHYASLSLYNRYATVLAIQMQVVYRLVVFNIFHTLKQDALLLKVIIDMCVFLSY